MLKGFVDGEALVHGMGHQGFNNSHQVTMRNALLEKLHQIIFPLGVNLELKEY